MDGHIVRLVVASALLLAVDTAVLSGCKWNLNKDLAKNEPLIFSGSEAPALVIPVSGGLALGAGDKIHLVCPGKGNTVFGTGARELEVSCAANKLIYDGEHLPLSSFECSSGKVSDLVYSKMPCAFGKGVVYKMGWNSTKGFAPSLETCYDKINEAALYSTNILYGEALSSAEIESDRPNFRTQGLTYGTTTADKYKQSKQKEIFGQLLGTRQADKYITAKSFLARGHLAPDADFLFGTWSTATYYYVNVAPEWQAVNGGNWVRVESMTRAVAIQRQEDLIAYTGTFGVLQLPNSKGDNVDIYLLERNKLPVPKWYWKIIYSPKTQQGIGLVSLNNPFSNGVDDSELLCRDICKETNWDRPEWNRYDRGFTYCCSANELIKAVGYMPTLSISGNMHGPSKKKN